MNNNFSGPVIIFHEFSIPEEAISARYVALIDAYHLPAPFPYTKMAIGLKHKIVKEMDWHLLTPNHQPEKSLEGHLEFALKYERIDLCVLKKSFEVIDKRDAASLN